MTIETIIFDLGNVLVDWNPDHLYSKVFSDPKRKDYFFKEVCTEAWHAQQDAGRSTREATRELLQKFPEWAEEINAFYGRWQEMFKGPIDGSVAILKSIKESGYKTYALTNWSAELFEEALEQFPFFHWFDGRVVSGEEKLLKPDPRIYKILLDRFSIDPQSAVFIDDRKENVAAATALGIRSIQFTSPEQLREELAALGVL